MQHDLNSIHNWLSSHFLKLNTTKSKKNMIFLLKPQSFFDCPPLNISDSPLECVYSYKYLGQIMNCTLSWTSHIQITAKKAKRLLGLIFHNLLFSFFFIHTYGTVQNNCLASTKIWLRNLGPSIPFYFLHFKRCSILRS